MSVNALMTGGMIRSRYELGLWASPTAQAASPMSPPLRWLACGASAKSSTSWFTTAPMASSSPSSTSPFTACSSSIAAAFRLSYSLSARLRSTCCGSVNSLSRPRGPGPVIPPPPAL